MQTVIGCKLSLDADCHWMQTVIGCKLCSLSKLLPLSSTSYCTVFELVRVTKACRKDKDFYRMQKGTVLGQKHLSYKKKKKLGKNRQAFIWTPFMSIVEILYGKDKLLGGVGGGEEERRLKDPRNFCGLPVKMSTHTTLLTGEEDSFFPFIANSPRPLPRLDC